MRGGVVIKGRMGWMVHNMKVMNLECSRIWLDLIEYWFGQVFIF